MQTDHIGGHIKSSLHVPSATHATAIPSLVRNLKDKPVVIFHCALSQVRGPKAALQYVRERERLVGPGTTRVSAEPGEIESVTYTEQNGPGVGAMLKKDRGEQLARDGKGLLRHEAEEGEDGWEDVEQEAELYSESKMVINRKKQQRVLVLEGGFVGWQATYGEDERLTEGYSKELWEDAY